MRVVVPQTLQQHTLTIQKVLGRKGFVTNKQGRFEFEQLGPDHYSVLFTPLPRRRRSPSLPAVQVSLTPNRVTSLFIDKKAAASEGPEVAQQVAKWLSGLFKQNIPKSSI